jgi:hypothetical protein
MKVIKDKLKIKLFYRDWRIRQSKNAITIHTQYTPIVVHLLESEIH